jgi:parallel beta-helix repeat protein/predicted outer membrane repeat protein
MTRKSLICISAAVLWHSAANANTYYVDISSTNSEPPYSSWSTAATNIQPAIDLAHSNDTVYVSNGTYLITGTITLSNSITMQSMNGAETTVINGGGNRRCLYLSGHDIVIDGFTIANGKSSRGAGLYVEGDALVRNCIISNNYAYSALTDGGGGCYVEDSLVLNDCELINNTAYQCAGGAVLVKSTGGRLWATNCIFSGNASVPPYGGGTGGAICASTNLSLFNCVFDQNTGYLGGAVYAEKHALISDCLFTSNSATHGAGIRCDTLLDVENSIFAFHSGAAIQSYYADITVSNCSFYRNKGTGIASTYGGSNLISNCEFTENGRGVNALSFTIRSCKFSGNATGGEGAAVNGAGTIEDSLFEENSAGGAGGAIKTGDSSISRCIFLNNHSGGRGGAIRGAGSIEDTLFKNNSAEIEGGAIFCYSGPISIYGSTFSLNQSAGHGGGLSAAEDAWLENCTLVDNTAALSGGGVYAINDLSMTHCTLSGNLADADADGAGNGGGVFHLREDGRSFHTVELNNTIVSGNWDTPNNASTETGIYPDCYITTPAAFTDSGYNLFGVDNGRITLGASTLKGTLEAPLSAGIEELSDNGGRTPTCNLMATSPALDAGSSSVSFDQRECPRPMGGAVDIGAVEYTTAALPPVADSGFSAGLILTDFADPDLDGAGLYDEWMLDRDPYEAENPFVIEADLPDSLRIPPGSSARLYAIEGTDDLLSGPWTSVYEFSGQTSLNVVDMSLYSNRFYRVKVSIPAN